MNETEEREDKKLTAKKSLALGLSMIFVLCIGIIWGYVARDSMPDECLSYDVKRQTDQTHSQENLDSEIQENENTEAEEAMQQ